MMLSLPPNLWAPLHSRTRQVTDFRSDVIAK